MTVQIFRIVCDRCATLNLTNLIKFLINLETKYIPSQSSFQHESKLSTKLDNRHREKQENEGEGKIPKER